MAVISKIRRHSAIIITLVGLAMASFVLSDFFKKSGRDIKDIAVIAGESIDPRSYESKVQEAIENYKQNSGTLSVDQATIDLLRQQVWDNLLDEIILGREYKDLGLAVSPEEIFDMVTGKEPHSSVVKAFSNPKTGQFNAADVLNFLKTMDNDPTGKSKAQWLDFEKAIKKDRLSEKFYTMIKKGIYVTSKEAARDDESKNKKANIRFAVKRYTAIADSVIKPSDKDLKKYYEENKYLYKQKPSRSVDYVVFDVLPTTDDTLDLKEWINRKKEEFKITDNDTVFIASNADSPFKDNWNIAGALSAQIDTLLFQADSGIVLGPYIEDGSFKIVKLLGTAMRPDSVKARHILIKTQSRNDTIALHKADSLKKLIQNGSNFALLAMQLSEDPGSGSKGGELGWFAEGTMVKPFNDSCFDGKKGDLKIVKSQFGVHLVEILDRKPPVKKIKVGIVDRKIEPSQKTFSAIYNKASRFAGEYNTLELFEEGAGKEGLDKRSAQNLRTSDNTLPGIDQSREIVRWSFYSEKGKISDVFECGNKYIIAALKQVNDDEYTPLDDVRPQVEAGARSDLKARKIMDEIKSNDDNNIDDFAKNMNLPVESANDLTMATSFIPGLGREPAVTGYVFSPATKTGALSPPIKGKQGVYVVSVVSFSEYTPPADLSAVEQNLVHNFQTRVDYEVFEALKEKAKITDNRHLFY